MFIYTEKSFQRLYKDELIVEAEAHGTYFIADEIYPKVKSILDTPEGKRKFIKIVADFINRNSTKLTTSGPLYLIPYTHTDKKQMYDLFNIQEDDIIAVVKKVISSIGASNDCVLLRQNPVFTLLYCVIRYFTMNKDQKALNSSLAITALAFYPSMFTKYFKFEPNQGVMQFTIDNLSKRFSIKKTNHIFGTLCENIQSAWVFHEKLFKDGSDKECVHFIQRVRNGQNSLLKKIAQNYFDNHKKGLTTTTAVDSFDDGVNVDVENNSNKVENITNKVILKMLTNGINLPICDIASQISNVSKIELRNYLTKILIDKNSSEMRSFIESILFIYLYDEKHSFEEINSKRFLVFAIALFKKTNSKDENVRNIKGILDKWGDNSGLYGKFTRVATRVDYTKAIFLYFILSIQQFG